MPRFLISWDVPESGCCGHEECSCGSRDAVIEATDQDAAKQEATRRSRTAFERALERDVKGLAFPTGDDEPLREDPRS